MVDTSSLISDPTLADRIRGGRLLVPTGVLATLGSLARRSNPAVPPGAAAVALRSLWDAHRRDAARVMVPSGSSTRWLADRGVTDPDRASALAATRDTGHPLLTSDVALLLLAAGCGLTAVRWPPAGDRIPAGWVTLEVPTGVVDALHDGTLTVDDLPDTPDGPLVANTGVLLVGPGSRSLGRVRADGTVRAVNGHRRKGPVEGIRPRNLTQQLAADLLCDPGVTLVGLLGPAGTGKTLMAFAWGLRALEAGQVDRILIYRPPVPVGGHDLGFLPGTLDEKLAPWMDPVEDLLTVVCGGRAQARERARAMIRDGQLVLAAVGVARGRTYHRTWVVVDEAQNLEPGALKVLLTRVGEGSRVVVCGDPSQIDHPYIRSGADAASVLVRRMSGDPEFGHVVLDGAHRSRLAAVVADRFA